ncbi:MAG: DNA-directed RNA polymerase subunit alpha [Bacteroidales bacterium]|jgi:DNA-directed RNA polymerase subunit alpha|nr:DNA-directed RNA polymerase subunit alpha [Bacteroidales bacterium]
MAISFIKPDKVIMLESDDKFGVFEFRPLEPGYGTTVGNAIRRVLLSALEGYAVTNVKIEGVDHEFTTIKGVVEDVTEIILNIKKIRFKRLMTEQVQGEKFSVTVSGKNVLTAGDLNAFMTNFQVLNPEQVLCNMDPSIKLTIDFWVGKGRGYVPGEENTPMEADFGIIQVDSIFTPIVNVKFFTENYRVEQKTDYEKLVLEIKTDGSIHPKEALKEAARVLIQHFMLFTDEKIVVDDEKQSDNEEFDEEVLRMRQLLKQKLVDMDLSVRALNCLKAAEVVTLGELVKFNKNDLLKFRNFGKKSLTELDELLESLNLTFGMDISKYKLDKE